MVLFVIGFFYFTCMVHWATQDTDQDTEQDTEQDTDQYSFSS